ncbi:MAG TPA: hypothetical protein VIB60_02610 [Methylomirabilota bacterium]
MIREVRLGARFALRLPGFLRRPVALAEARTVLRGRLERREADLLGLARTIYGVPGSPYGPLLRRAGCEYGDLERLVARDGVEGALTGLFRAGVYLTIDEFKGRRPAVRGDVAVRVEPELLRNPRSELHVPARTSGSRSGGTPVLVDLAFLRECAVDTLLALDARGAAAWEKGIWLVPGGAALARLMEFAGFRPVPARWFSQIDPGTAALHPRYRWSARFTRWSSVLAGAGLPRPEHVSLEDPLPAAGWMRDVLRGGRRPHLMTFPSSAARLCHAAVGSGLDLAGAHFTLTGEPITATRLAAIRRAGADAQPRYGIIEAGPIGLGCLAPEAPDDVHLLHDLVAAIQPGAAGAGAGLPGDALLFTSLRATAPFALLNVSMGDRATMVMRRCGCPLERLGWATHLRDIGSLEKLTAAGMSFLDTDVIRVLEEVLPARFGGGPTDYQMVEEEGETGEPRLRLLVSPRVGDVDPEAVADAFLTALSAGSGVERVMGLMWRQARLLRVERRSPQPTDTGKILHLHVASRPGQARLRRDPATTGSTTFSEGVPAARR